MLTSIFTSVIAYASTNIDDIFVLMILLAQVKGAAKGKLIAGHFLGVGLITVISFFGAQAFHHSGIIINQHHTIHRFSGTCADFSWYQGLLPEGRGQPQHHRCRSYWHGADHPG